MPSLPPTSLEAIEVAYQAAKDVREMMRTWPLDDHPDDHGRLLEIIYDIPSLTAVEVPAPVLLFFWGQVQHRVQGARKELLERLDVYAKQMEAGLENIDRLFCPLREGLGRSLVDLRNVDADYQPPVKIILTAGREMLDWAVNCREAFTSRQSHRLRTDESRCHKKLQQECLTIYRKEVDSRVQAWMELERSWLQMNSKRNANTE